MALFKFVSAILKDQPIDIYNNEMFRDFTYVDDLVQSIRLLINKIPKAPLNEVLFKKIVFRTPRLLE